MVDINVGLYVGQVISWLSDRALFTQLFTSFPSSWAYAI